MLATNSKCGVLCTTPKERVIVPLSFHKTMVVSHMRCAMCISWAGGRSTRLSLPRVIWCDLALSRSAKPCVPETECPEQRDWSILGSACMRYEQHALSASVQPPPLLSRQDLVPGRADTENCETHPSPHERSLSFSSPRCCRVSQAGTNVNLVITSHD